MGVTDRPCVIDFRVDPTEKCFPMVPAGASNDDIILGPGQDDAVGPAHEVGSDFAFGGLEARA
jgi:hypothetical protein